MVPKMKIIENLSSKDLNENEEYRSDDEKMECGGM